VDFHLDDDVVVGPTWSAVVGLSVREARRMLLSPAILVALGLLVLVRGAEIFAQATFSLPTARTAYDIIVFFSALYLGLLMYIAAHLVTSSARRSGAEPQLAASTLSVRQRSAGMCLGVIVGPGGLAFALMIAAALLGNSITASNPDGFAPDESPLSGLFLVQLALLTIGGGLFAVMWASWLRFPGSLPLGLVVLVFSTAWLLDGDRAPVHSWPWFAPYVSIPSWFDAPWTSAGSHSWHLAYLVGLCALAVCGTMLRERDDRNRWIGLTAVVLVATGVAGAVQLS
jgi:hypothetical protein